MKQKSSLPISLRGIPENDISQTITWYDAENDRLFFDSYSGGSGFSPCSGGPIHSNQSNNLKPRPFPSPGTSPCTDHNHLLAAKPLSSSSSSPSCIISSTSSNLQHHHQHHVFTPNSSHFNSSASTSLHSSPSLSSALQINTPIAPPAPPAPPLISSYSAPVLPSNIKITPATIASEVSHSTIPVTATIVPATEVVGCNNANWGYAHQGKKRGGGGGGGGGGGSGSRRNSANSRQTSSYRNRSGSAPTINYASVAMATVLDYPSSVISSGQQKVYTATVIESPGDVMDVDTLDTTEDHDVLNEDPMYGIVSSTDREYGWS